jgi:hypothetical protein
MQRAILKIKEGMPLSLDLVYDCKGYSLNLFHENVPLITMEYTLHLMLICVGESK